MLNLLAATALTSFLSVSDVDRAPDPTHLTARITQAAMFKNGFAVIQRVMDVPGGGDYLLEQIPQASLGTLWFAVSPGAKLLSVVNTEVATPSVMPAASLAAFLQLNVGKRLTLRLSGTRTVSGTLMSATGEILELKEGTRTLVIETRAVVQILSGDNLIDASKGTLSSRGIRFHVDAQGPAHITMLSMERGLSWAPAYAVNLLPDKRLEVVGKATVVDDLDTLPGIDAMFITGWPNLPYANQQDPLVANVATILAPPTGFGGGGMGGGGFAFGNQARAAMPMDSAMQMSTLPGEQSEDLFFYRQPDVRLRRGDRGYFLVLKVDAPYEDLYTWDVPDFVSDGQYSPNARAELPQEVWHKIRFTNTGKTPFSTGPATILRDDQILGQDEETYTPAGVKTELKITQALDLSADQIEEEVSRERGALKNTFNPPTYDLVTLKGTLTMTSHERETIPFRIRKNLTGDVISSSDGKVTRTVRGLRDTNSHATIEWSGALAPGKTATYAYQYKVYIRS